MKVTQFVATKNTPASDVKKFVSQSNPDLMISFAAPSFFTGDYFKSLVEPQSKMVFAGCSTAGEIGDKGLHEDSAVFTAVKFNQSPGLKVASSPYQPNTNAVSVGEKLGRELKNPNLKAVFVMSQGVAINGSELIQGIQKEVGPKVILTGGLAGDYGKFEKTYTVLNGHVSTSDIIAIGFSGPQVQVGYGSLGGWEPFGPVRRVTKAQGNILFEIDGQPALGIYKTYLGKKADELPGSGLLYPFAVLDNDRRTTGLIRTILGVDEKNQSLTLAGDIAQGGMLQLMHAKNQGLVNGAHQAAEMAKEMLHGGSGDKLAFLISCVGRKIVMGDDTIEEVEAVQDVFGPGTHVTGFYSNGEICPFQGVLDCKLHNQTMTITYITE